MTDRSENDNPAQAPEGERIAKVMARAGLCSRRDAERWIADGRVSVNGAVLESPAVNVTAQDRINVDGRPIARRERTRLFMFHKPRGTVTTDHDPEGRDTIFDVLPDGLPRLVTVGRLDINTEGLLLLTNDGGLARVLELPSTGWLRRYRVRAHGSIDQARLDALRDGLVIEGVEYRGIEAKIDRVQGANVWLTMGLREGKNREIKRVLEHLGLAVNRLIRVSYGPFQLGELEDGAIEEVKTRVLKDQLGESLAAEAGADFEAPVLDVKDREKIARRHPNDERPAREAPVRERAASPHGKRPEPGRGARPRPAREAEGRGGDRFPRRASGPAPRDSRDERPLSARDVLPRRRKHVSVMRAEKEARSEGRRKIERTETADRRGRSVPVERVSGGARDEARASSRNARRFSSERAGASSPGEKRGGWKRAEDGGARPPRRKSADSPPRREAGDRPPRKDFGDRGPRQDFGDRAPRKDFGDRPPRKDFADRGPRKDFGDRPPRKDFGDRPPRKDFGDRPAGRGKTFGAPGAGRGGARGAERGGDRAPGSGGGYKGAGGAGRTASGPGRSGGGKPGGGRPAGGRPGAGRPSGGRPPGGRPGGSRPPR